MHSPHDPCPATPSAPRPRPSLGSPGYTILEMTVAMVIFLGLMLAAGTAMHTQFKVFNEGRDAHNIHVPAQVALQRMRNELKSAVRNSPGYAVNSTSITYRPLVGFLSPSDAQYSSKKSAGLVSDNHIEYAPYTRTFAYQAIPGTLLFTAAGTLPTGVKASETIASNVVAFSFFNGGSLSATLPAPTTDTALLGIEIEIRVRAASATSTADLVNSNFGGRRQSTKIRLFEEILLSGEGQTVVGP